MKKIKLFCFGFGQVAKYFIRNLINEKYDLTMVATNTSETQTKIVDNFKFKSFFFCNEKFDKNLINELKSSNLVLISIPPINQEDLVIKLFEEDIKSSNCEWITYLSATSIYGDKKGNWVNEKTYPNPTTKNGKARLYAEKKWINLFKKNKIPIQIFRLSGIYSKDNNVLNRLKNGRLKIVNKKNHFFSRIHIEDIANILNLSLKKFKAGEIYNISDDYPCSNKEICEFATSLMKMKNPKIIEVEEIESERVKNFYKESKKVNNKKMKETFSYNLKFPTYKEGLGEIFNQLI